MHLKVTANNKVSGDGILSDATETHVATRETHITLKTPLMNLDRNWAQKIPSLRFPIFRYTPFSLQPRAPSFLSKSVLDTINAFVQSRKLNAHNFPPSESLYRFLESLKFGNVAPMWRYRQDIKVENDYTSRNNVCRFTTAFLFNSLKKIFWKKKPPFSLFLSSYLLCYADSILFSS